MRKILLVLALLLLCHPAMAQVVGNPVISQQTSAAASTLAAKTSLGYLYSLTGQSGTAGYILVFDAAAAPSNGTVTPRFCFAVTAGGNYAQAWTEYPVPFANGIIIMYSTTGCYTLTASTTAFLSAQVR